MRKILENISQVPFFQGNPVSMFVLQTLVLYECEKHPREEDWEEVGSYLEDHCDCAGLGFGIGVWEEVGI